MSRVFTGLAADHLDLLTAIPAAPPFTISAWVRLNTLGTAHQAVVLGQSADPNNRYSLSHQAADTVAAQEKDATTLSQAATSQSIPDTTSFHLWVARFTSHSSRGVALDNNAIATNSAGPRTPASPIQLIRVSGDPSGANKLDGLITQIGIWDIDLVDLDVLALFSNVPLLVNPGHLIHYWPLSAGQSPEPDYGLRGEPLIVSGAPAFSALEPPSLNSSTEAGIVATILKGIAG